MLVCDNNRLQHKNRGRIIPCSKKRYTRIYSNGGVVIHVMRILFRPQRSAEQITYTFRGESVTALIGDAEDAIEDTFDFTGLPDGELDKEREVETVLPVCPIIFSKRVDGVLHLELLNWIGRDAPYESRFPEWVELPLSRPKEAGKGGIHQNVLLLSLGARRRRSRWRGRRCRQESGRSKRGEHG